jgi:predicted dehydrogenase
MEAVKLANYRATVIGCGGRSGAHLAAYALMDKADPVACCDLEEEKATKRAEEFGVKAYTDAKAMIETEKPDIVHIVTAPNVRVELLSLVSDLGVPMATVEKPLATGVADWRKLCELSKSTDTKIAVCHQFRWHPHMVKCQEAVKSGKLGDVKFLEFSAGMNISGQGTHILNYGSSLNGNSPVMSVFGTAAGTDQTDTMHPAPDNTVAHLVFENGVHALWCNGATALRTGDPDTIYQHVRAAAYCEKGRVNYEEFANWEIVSPDGVESGTCEDCDGCFVAQAGLHNAVIDWHESGDPSKCGTNFEQSLHEWAVVLALYQSALERRIIMMADFDPPEDLFDRLLSAL